MKDKMKTGLRSGMLLVIIIAGTMTLSAQPGMRGMRMDSTRMHMRMMNRGQMMQMMRPDSMPMHRMGRGMQNGMCPCQMMQQNHGNMMRGMEQGMGIMPGNRGWMRPGMRPGFERNGRLIEVIPNLTDKQKKEIAVLQIDQQSEMKKLQDEHMAKMKAMRQAHKTAIEKLLTPEQKKWFEENSPKQEEVPMKLDKSVPPIANPK
jgi:hypothetical protein